MIEFLTRGSIFTGLAILAVIFLGGKFIDLIAELSVRRDRRRRKDDK